jgi:hypothetical protein
MGCARLFSEGAHCYNRVADDEKRMQWKAFESI